MRFYLGNGQRALAARQYEICRSTLAKELGIPPMEDTRQLYRQICSDTHNRSFARGPKEQIGLDQVMRQLREVNQTIDLAKEQIQQVVQLLDKHSEYQESSSKAHRNG